MQGRQARRLPMRLVSIKSLLPICKILAFVQNRDVVAHGVPRGVCSIVISDWEGSIQEGSYIGKRASNPRYPWRRHYSAEVKSRAAIRETNTQCLCNKDSGFGLTGHRDAGELSRCTYLFRYRPGSLFFAGVTSADPLTAAGWQYSSGTRIGEAVSAGSTQVQ